MKGNLGSRGKVFNHPNTHIEHIEHNTQPTVMSYSRGTSVYKISCKELGLPAGVVIGRGGSTVNLMKSISRAQIRIRNNVVEMRGGHREIITAKSLLTRLKDNYSKGIIGLNMSQPTRKPRRKIRVKTNAATGWSNVEANREAVSKTSAEPKKVSHASQNSFAGLDFDSDSDEDSAAEEQTTAVQEVNEDFPALPSSPAIKLKIREKVNPDGATFKTYLSDRRERRAAARAAAGLSANPSWADICDDEDEQKRLGTDSDDEEGLFLQSH